MHTELTLLCALIAVIPFSICGLVKYITSPLCAYFLIVLPKRITTTKNSLRRFLFCALSLNRIVALMCINSSAVLPLEPEHWCLGLFCALRYHEHILFCAWLYEVQTLTVHFTLQQETCCRSTG